MSRCLISLGANLGDPYAAIELARRRLQELFDCAGGEFRCSAFYRTPPVGGPAGQPPFVNAVVALETDLDPWQAWGIIRQVEAELGRVRMARWEARKIDLDILLFGDSRIWTPQLKIPHPRMCMRRFILIPASEVAGDWVDPVSGQTIATLAKTLRAGPGSLLLLTESLSAATPILEEAARLAVAQWQDPQASVETQPQTRWVSATDVSALDGAPDGELLQRAKLVVVLADAVDADGAAWEDVHAVAAAKLNLCNRENVSALALPGARYLLASDDPQWAVHELVSALEAMDCPIERIAR